MYVSKGSNKEILSFQQLFRDDDVTPKLAKSSYNNCVVYSINNLCGTTLYKSFDQFLKGYVKASNFKGGMTEWISNFIMKRGVPLIENKGFIPFYREGAKSLGFKKGVEFMPH